jgi:hypothetical protein
MTLKRCVFLLVFCLTPTSLFSNKLYFPEVAFGGGYTTTIVLMNTGTTNVSSSFLVYGQTGALLMSLPVTVAGGGSTRVTIADPGASTVISWGVIDAGTGTVQGMATFELCSADGVLIRSAGVLGVEAGNGFSLPVDIAGNGFAANTAIFMANINPGSAVTLVFALVSEGGAGSPSGFDTRFVTLAPGHQLAEFVTSIWPQLISGFRGTLVVSVQENMQQPSLVLTGLSEKNGLLSSLPVIPTNSCNGCWDY